MQAVKTLVLTGYGTNCEKETAYTARKAGSDYVEVAHFADIIQEKLLITDFNFLIFPGGFLDGDHLGAAQAAAARFKNSSTKTGRKLLAEVHQLLDSGGLILGICNGFQLLVKLGFLPALNKKFQRQVSLSFNDSARFEDRWVHLRTNPESPCIFTRSLDRLYLPVRHGEGKIVPLNKDVLDKIQDQELIALQYSDEQGNPTQEYPENPNGSPLAIAGLSSPSGQIFGLMPHPEAYNHKTNHPQWTRGAQALLGTVLFENAVNYLKNKMKESDER